MANTGIVKGVEGDGINIDEEVTISEDVGIGVILSTCCFRVVGEVVVVEPLALVLIPPPQPCTARRWAVMLSLRLNFLWHTVQG